MTGKRKSESFDDDHGDAEMTDRFAAERCKRPPERLADVEPVSNNRKQRFARNRSDKRLSLLCARTKAIVVAETLHPVIFYFLFADRSVEEPAAIREVMGMLTENYLPNFLSMALSVVLRVPGLEPSPLTMLLMLIGRPTPCWWPFVVGAVEVADPEPGVDVAGGGGVLPSARIGRLVCGGCSPASGG